MSGEKIFIARQDTLEDVRDRIGVSTDTGGTETAGSLMGKVNAVLGKAGGNLAVYEQTIVLNANAESVAWAWRMIEQEETIGSAVNDVFKLNSATVAECRTWAEIATVNVAMKAIANSEVAMTAVVASDAATEAIANSSIAMTAITNSSVAITAIANSSTVMTVMTNSNVAMKAIAGSSTAMTVIANSEVAMTAIPKTLVSLKALADSRTAMTAINDSPYVKYMYTYGLGRQSTTVTIGNSYTSTPLGVTGRVIIVTVVSIESSYAPLTIKGSLIYPSTAAAISGVTLKDTAIAVTDPSAIYASVPYGKDDSVYFYYLPLE